MTGIRQIIFAACCGESPAATITLVCAHEHVDSLRACYACAAEMQQAAGLMVCERCENGAELHGCPTAVFINWDDGTVTHVQDTEGRNLL